jgi:hypothetical protein
MVNTFTIMKKKIRVHSKDHMLSQKNNYNIDKTIAGSVNVHS